MFWQFEKKQPTQPSIRLIRYPNLNPTIILTEACFTHTARKIPRTGNELSKSSRRRNWSAIRWYRRRLVMTTFPYPDPDPPWRQKNCA